MLANYRKHALDASRLALSSAVKLFSGVLVFLLLARVLGAEQFGRLMFAFSLANLTALPVNFGLTVYFLREGALTRDYGAQLIPKIIGLRLTIAALVASLVALVMLLLGLDGRLYAIFLMVALVETFIELMLARLRLGAKYKDEMKLSSVQALLQIVIVVAFGVYYGDPGFVAIGFLISRVIALYAAIKVAAGLGVFSIRPAFDGAWALVKSSSANFYDFFVQSSLVYIDVVLLGFFSTSQQVGLYQAAMKVVQGLSQGISILVNLMLPKISRMMDSRVWHAKYIAIAYFVFIAVGAFLASLMLVSADFVEHELLRGDFEGFAAVFYWLAIFLLVRYFGAAGGMLLIAGGDRKIRPAVMTGAVSIVVAASCFLVPAGGAIGMVESMLITYLFISVSLFVAVAVGSKKWRSV